MPHGLCCFELLIGTGLALCGIMPECCRLRVPNKKHKPIDRYMKSVICEYLCDLLGTYSSVSITGGGLAVILFGLMGHMEDGRGQPFYGRVTILVVSGNGAVRQRGASTHCDPKLKSDSWPQAWQDRKSTRLNSSHSQQSRMPSSA